jgi:nucleoid-associated protein YgaU
MDTILTKNKPLAIFSILAIAAAGTAGYMALNPKPMNQPVVEVAKPVVVEPAPQVAVAAAPVPAKIADPIAPSFDTVRIETSGEAVIAGRAEPETEVVAKLDGIIVASTTSTADGSFVLIPTKPLPAGAGTLTLETKKNGIVQVSTSTVAVAVKPQGQGEATVAVLTPDAPTKVLQAPALPSKAVVLDAVDYDAAGNIVFSGRAQPDNAVRLYIDNAIAGEVKADVTGKWTYVGTTTMPVGTHVLRADAIAADGSVSSRVELPFKREEPAKVAAAPVVEVPTTAVAAAEPAKVEPPKFKRMVIQPGNNLWVLSRELYGYGKNYTVIYEANKDQIRNPRLIYPGQVLTAPIALDTQP